MKREFNGFHIHSTLITVIITKIILHGNKALSQVVDENTKKARKVPYARGSVSYTHLTLPTSDLV